MRKSTLAIAIAAAIAVPMTAQADTTLYGQAHMSLDYQDSDAGDGFDLLSNSSRVGVKGSHKLSDALSAIYQMEWGVTMDGETGTMSARNRVAGLKGGFGTVLFGRHDTPFKTLGNAVAEDWGSTQMGGARQIRSNGDGGLSWDQRLSNVLAYISPSFGPASVFIAYSPDVLGQADNEFVDPAPGGAEEVSATSILLNLGDKKKYYLGIAWEQHEFSALNNAAAPEDAEAIRVGGIANFGPFRLHGLYQMATDQGGVAGVDRDVYGVGASFKSGANTFKAQYYTADDVDLPGGAGNNTGSDLVMVGWDHSLGKSTDVYLQYAQISNDDNAFSTLIGNGHGDSSNDGASAANPTTGNGSDIDGFSAGLRVKF